MQTTDANNFDVKFPLIPSLIPELEAKLEINADFERFMVITYT